MLIAEDMSFVANLNSIFFALSFKGLYGGEKHGSPQAMKPSSLGLISPNIYATQKRRKKMGTFSDNLDRIVTMGRGSRI